MADRFQNFIGGKWVDAANGTSFDDINPANKAEVLGVFPRSDHRDIDRAVESAKAEFPAWRRLPAPRRGEILFRAADTLRRRKIEMARLVTHEVGSILKESQAEIESAIAFLLYLAGEGRRLWGETTPSEQSDRWAFSVRAPLGVVGAITPWDHPFAVACAKVTAALVAGNAVVLKPAEEAPLTAVRLVEILLEAGIPSGVLNLVQGMGEEAGAPLVRHPDVTLISFTGSTDVGREVAIACAADHRRVSLELGAKNSILVMEDADLDAAVEGTIWGAFARSGQRAMAASRILVHRKVLRDFTERLLAKAQGLRLGDGLLPTTEMGPIIDEAHLKRIHGYTRLGLKEGAKLLCGGEGVREGECKKGFFYAPTIFGDVSPKMRIAQEEIFGPTVGLLTVTGFEEAIEVANATRSGLSAAIYTRDITRALRAVELLSSGVTLVNPSTVGAEVHLPFGGMRQTGNGRREGGRQILDVFTEWKTVYLDYSGKLPRGTDPAERISAKPSNRPEGGAA